MSALADVERVYVEETGLAANWRNRPIARERSAGREICNLDGHEPDRNIDRNRIDELELLQPFPVVLSICRKTCCSSRSYVSRRYIMIIQILHDQIVITSDDSETSTHLLPATLSLCVCGVKLSMSSCVMKFEPPPNMILLRDTYSIVYHKMVWAIT